MIVDVASTYTFAGSGQFAGGSSLVKKNTGTLVLNTVNTYGGGTIISNGTIQLGVNNAVSSTGSGDVSLVSPGKLDLNGFTDAINGLDGSGTVDVANGGASTLTIGANNNSGTFTGKIQNASGTMSIVKNGTGSQILGGSNSYTGTTVTYVNGAAAQVKLTPDYPTTWTDFGVLFPNKLAGNGGIFYCPALDDKKSPLGSLQYSPLLSTSSASGDSPNCRGSYVCNPHVVNPAGNSSNVDHVRQYTKASSVNGRIMFGMDFIDSTQFDSTGSVLINGINFAHSRSKGWNVLFSDGSVVFKNDRAAAKAAYLAGGFPSLYDVKGINDLATSFEQ